MKFTYADRTVRKGLAVVPPQSPATSMKSEAKLMKRGCGVLPKARRRLGQLAACAQTKMLF